MQISCLYLEALEQGDYGRLPSLIYTRNFVKKYGLRLNVNMSDLLELFEQEWQLFEKMQLSFLNVGQSEGINKTDLWKMPRWLRWIGATMAIVAVMTYLGFELYDLRQAPTLVLHTPQEELMLEKQVVEVTGQTDPEASLLINDQPILSDSEGNFSETVALQPGLNVIEITATKKYSRANTQYRKIIVQDATTFSSSDGEEPPVS